ncbi:MAG: MFS transporter [Acidobacteria bacterium]|nr:MAG: MFS transporter [Acidobacteriota bacterium]
MNSELQQTQKISVMEKIGYGLGDTAANLVWRTMMVFLPIFYTDVFGLSAAAVGTLLLVCRYWDGITDYIMGLIADRTRTRWGRFRPWVLWTALPFGVMTVLTFTTPDLDYSSKLIYAYATYSGLILVYTANNIPYSALTGVISADPAERTSLSSYRFIFAFLGGIITQGFNIYLVAFFGAGNDIRGYQMTMTLFAALSVALFVITFLTTRERVQPAASENPSILEDSKDLIRNKAWLMLFGIGVLWVTFTTLKQGVTLFYFKYYLNDMSLAPPFMILGLLAAMAGAALTRPLTDRFGKKWSMIYCLVVALVSSALLFLAGPTDVALIFLLSSITELSTGPVITIFFAMLADAADYSEWKNNRRATGLVFSAGTLSMKFGTGVAGALTGWLLMLFGYAANVAQTAEALLGIRLLISVFPAVAALLLIIVVRFYPLDEERLREIEQDLLERRKGLPEPVSM